jgi:hypothetical protein
MEPNFLRAHAIVAAYTEKGMFPEALGYLDAKRSMVDERWYWAAVAHVNGRPGRTLAARNALQVLKSINKRNQIDPELLVWAYLSTGN